MRELQIQKFITLLATLGEGVCGIASFGHGITRSRDATGNNGATAGSTGDSAAPPTPETEKKKLSKLDD